MNYQVVELDESYNLDLLALSQSTNTGSELFQVDRSPNYFQLGTQLGETTHYGLVKNKELIGSIAVSKQERIVKRQVEDVYYLNDLRIHPRYHGTLAYYRLIDCLLQKYSHEYKVKWMFSTVLDSNIHQSSLTKGSERIPKGKIIGRTIHLGIPMFTGTIKDQLKGDKNVIELEGEEAWSAYQSFVQEIQFTPLDKKLFTEKNGIFLALKEKGKIVALGKLVDQSHARRLILSSRLTPIMRRAVNGLCWLKGCPPLPAIGEVFKHGYLAYYVSLKPSINPRTHFISYIRRHYYQDFTYVFLGLSEEFKSRDRGMFGTQLSSTTLAYGNVPEHLTMDFHELTLI